VLFRHWSAEFMKHVLPRLLRPVTPGGTDACRGSRPYRELDVYELEVNVPVATVPGDDDKENVSL